MTMYYLRTKLFCKHNNKKKKKLKFVIKKHVRSLSGQIYPGDVAFKITRPNQKYKTIELSYLKKFKFNVLY